MPIVSYGPRAKMTHKKIIHIPRCNFWKN